MNRFHLEVALKDPRRALMRDGILAHHDAREAEISRLQIQNETLRAVAEVATQLVGNRDEYEMTPIESKLWDALDAAKEKGAIPS